MGWITIAMALSMGRFWMIRVDTRLLGIAESAMWIVDRWLRMLPLDSTGKFFLMRSSVSLRVMLLFACR